MHNKRIPTEQLKIGQNLKLSSDHAPVMVTLNSKIIKKEQPPTLINRKTDWEMLRRLLEERVNPNLPVKIHEDIESAIWPLGNHHHCSLETAKPNIICAHFL